MQLDEVLHRKRAVIYCRVSTKEQVEEGSSLETQEKICKEFAFRNSLEVVEIFIEQGESAKTVNRTELKKLLAFCKDSRNKIQAVIAYKIDRISRNTDDYSKIRLELKSYGVEIKSTTEHFDSNPVGKFLENTMASIAQFDNDVRTERCVNGMKEAVRSGRYVWSAPIGYDNVKLGKATIRRNVEISPLIEKVFTLVASNTQSIDDIRKQMTDEGLIGKKGKPLSRSYFYYLLTNQLYTGWVYKFGEKHRGLFEPIISEELFEQVQRVLKRQGTKRVKHKTDNPDFPLRRFVLNPFGKKITGSWSKGRNKKYPYYHFNSKGKCTGKGKLESTFCDFMDKWAFDSKEYKDLEKYVHKHFSKRTENERKEAQRLEKHVADLRLTQSALIEKNLRNIINDALLTRELDRIENELLNANARLAEIDSVNTGKVSIEEAVEYLKDYLKKPSSIWIKSSIDKKLKLQWFQFPQGIVFDGKNFGTNKVCSFFKAKKSFSPDLSSTVHSKVKISNTTQIQKRHYYSTASSKKNQDELSCLAEIKNDIISVYRLMQLEDES